MTTRIVTLAPSPIGVGPELAARQAGSAASTT